MKVGQLYKIHRQHAVYEHILSQTRQKDHPITIQHYKNLTPEQIVLVCRKGVYPYEYIDSFDGFNEIELPPIDKFHGKLSGGISQEDHDHAQKVWKEFGCKNLGEYMIFI